MRRLARTAVLLVAALALCVPGPALAADGGPVAARRIAHAQDLYGNLAYAKALAAFRRALRARDITPPQTFQALLGEGWCLVILGRGDRADAVLVRALQMNPEWSAPPDLSPKLAGAVARARSHLRLARVTLALAAASVPGEVGISAVDPDHRVVRIVLSVRLPGGAWQTPEVERRGPGHWVAKVPGGAGQAVDAAATALNASGFPIARAGSRDAPKMLALPARPRAEVTPHPHHGEIARATPAPGPESRPHPAHPPALPAHPRAPAPATAPPARPGHGLMVSGFVTGGAAVVALGAATVFEIEAQNEAALYNGDPSKLGSSSHAQAVGAAAVAHANLATGLFIGAGVLAVGSGVLLLLGHGAAAARPSPEMSLAPVPGGALVVASGPLPF